MSDTQWQELDGEPGTMTTGQRVGEVLKSPFVRSAGDRGKIKGLPGTLNSVVGNIQNLAGSDNRGSGGGGSW